MPSDRGRIDAAVFSIVSGLYRLRDLQAREARARKVRPTPEKEADRKTELKGVLSCVACTATAAHLLQAAQRRPSAACPGLARRAHPGDHPRLHQAGRGHRRSGWVRRLSGCLCSPPQFRHLAARSAGAVREGPRPRVEVERGERSNRSSRRSAASGALAVYGPLAACPMCPIAPRALRGRLAASRALRCSCSLRRVSRSSAPLLLLACSSLRLRHEASTLCARLCGRRRRASAQTAQKRRYQQSRGSEAERQACQASARGRRAPPARQGRRDRRQACPARATVAQACVDPSRARAASHGPAQAVLGKFCRVHELCDSLRPEQWPRRAAVESAIEARRLAVPLDQ